MRGPCAGPSQFPLLKGSPSRRPRARGAGPHECGGRARKASRRAPLCGARVLPRSSPALAAPDREGAPAGGKGVRAVAVRGTRRRGARGAAACPGRAREPCPVGQQGGAVYGAPAPPSRGLPCGLPPVQSRPGGVARGAGLWGPVGGPHPNPGAHTKGGRRVTDGAAVHYRPPPFPPSLLELRAPPRPSVLIASPCPSSSSSSSPPSY